VYNHFPDLRNQSESREKLALPCEADAHVILFFGLIRAYKGLEVLIEALPLMQSTGKPVHLVIAGECYEDWTKYEEAIELLNLDCLVHIHAKFIANEDVPYFFGAADLVCLPYRSASQSGVTAIAIQYGKPVVASAVGGLVEYFKDNSLGTLCEPNDPEALASAVLKQLRAPALDAIELESVQRRFSWKAFAQVALSQEEATKA
jgi:glycosyltransferase involved in cell wall biosynthesis